MRWSTALAEAGITDPRVRRAYETQRRGVRKFAPHEYVAVRLLLPARLQPPVIAAVAYMHRTDELIDAGEVSVRRTALRSWAEQTGRALEADDPPADHTLSALWDAVRRHPHMAARVRAFLAGAPVEAAWTGFDTDADFQDYVDRYALPALMLTASLLAPRPDAGADDPFAAGCRALIEGWQRCDFLADLAEDVTHGRIGIPQDELIRHGVKFEDLRSKSQACVSALEHLVRSQTDRAETALAACRDLPSLVVAEYRPFIDALVGVQELRLAAVRRKGGDLLYRETGPAPMASVAVLTRQSRRAWAHRLRRSHDISSGTSIR